MRIIHRKRYRHLLGGNYQKKYIRKLEYLHKGFVEVLALDDTVEWGFL